MEQSVSELTNLLWRWEDEIPTPNYNPIPTLIKLCELFEAESKKYLNKHPDLFDGPFRKDLTCVLGQMYKILSSKNNFINKLVIDYLKEHHWQKRTEDNHNLNVAACRLIMNLILGLETIVVFENPEINQLIQRLFTWAENTCEPLQIYATGILASYMELTNIGANFKEDNNKLVPIILDRLHSYYTQLCEENEIHQSIQPHKNEKSDQPKDDIDKLPSKRRKKDENGICGDSNSFSPKSYASNWIQIYPPTLTTKLVYCLKYLVSTGKYQDFLSHTFDKNTLNLVTKIINYSEKQNGYLIFQALKYLAALLGHKKIATEFIGSQDLQVLLSLLTIKTQITDVDAIQGLASRELDGLSRNESVCQIISKSTLFNSGQLQSLIKNLVLQDKHQEHAIFQKYVSELMELVSGLKTRNGAEIEASLANINQAKVVAQTKVNFNEQQFLLLMYQHLIAKGLSSTAKSLIQEANPNKVEKNSKPFTYISHCRNQKSEQANSSNGPLEGEFSARGINSIPIHLNITRCSENRLKPEPEQKLESTMSKPVHKKTEQNSKFCTDNNTNSKVSLESIVTEYLTYKHDSYKHVTTCPKINLFVPLKYPDLKPRSSMCTNFVMRFSKNIHSRKLNQRLILSRFYPTKNFLLDEVKAYFTCCEFLSHNRVVSGTSNGKIKVLNLFTSKEELSYSTHSRLINNIQCTNDKRLILSSAVTPWQTPLTTIWSISEDAINMKYSLDYQEYCTFSNYEQNKILGTKARIATIYDLETSETILKLVPRYSNQYKENQAVFDATNKLVLSDGVMWDAISGKEIHKFDKLNEYVSEIFNPNGLDIISNKEVWDMRTFQLLRSVSSLDRCKVTFSKSGEGMYLYAIDHEIEHGYYHQTSFNTLDPHDYSNIATVNVKKFVCHMACNSYDTQIAIVEDQGPYRNNIKSNVRIYDVGRSINEDEAV